MLRIDRELLRSLTGEFLCTFIFIFTVCSSVLNEEEASVKSGPVGSAISTGFVALSIIYAFGSISGAHFNPAVTFGAMVGRKIDPVKGTLYIVLQILAALLAVGTLMGLFPDGSNVATRLVMKPGPGVTLLQAVAMEFIQAFILVFVIYATAMGVNLTPVIDLQGAFDPNDADRILQNKQRLHFAPISIGLTLGFLCFVGGAISSGAFNPARATAPALLALDFGSLWIYWVGDLLGGAAAAGIYLLIFGV